MPTSEEIAEAIAENVIAPQSVSQDGTTVVSKNIKDQVVGQHAVAADQAAVKPGFGFRFQQIHPVYR